MPSPVLALPCESRSTISTERPLAASAVPRLIAVVVLPTPPFWLATASTRPRPAGICSLAPDTLQPADDEDTALGVRQARLPLDPHCPASGRLGQFRLCLSALEKEAAGLGCGETRGQRQELRQRCERAGSDDVGRERRGGLDPGGVHGDWRSCRPRGLAQERRLATVALDQVDFGNAQDREDEAGQPGSAAEVDDATVSLGQEADELGAVQDVASPRIVEGAGADEIDGALPAAQQVEVGGEAVQCFT